MKKNKIKDAFILFFRINERNSNIKREIIGGLLTFICMCYILPVNATILSSMRMNQNGVFAITAIVASISTIMMGLLANYPIVLSSGMGLNAYLAYTICGQIFNDSYMWQKSLIVLTFSGLLFFIFSITPLRQKILKSISNDIKSIISACLGIFLCFVALKNSGIIVSDNGTFLKFGQLIKEINNNGVLIIDPTSLISLFGIILIISIAFLKIKNFSLKNLSIPITILILTILSIICAYSNLNIYGKTLSDGSYNNGLINFKDSSIWLPSGIKDVVFFGYLNNQSISFSNLLVETLKEPRTYIAIFGLFIVNIFDTTSTLFSVTSEININNDTTEILNLKRAMFADSFGCLISGPLGTSSVTTLAESTIGVSYGARTGLSSIITGLLILACVFLYPIFNYITASCITAPILFFVGLTIFNNSFQKINFKDIILSFSFSISIIFTLLTYSITKGVGLGLIFYTIMMLINSRKKELNITTTIITILFLINLLLGEILSHLK